MNTRLTSSNIKHCTVITACLNKLTENPTQFSLDGKFVLDQFSDMGYSSKTSKHLAGMFASTFGFRRKNEPFIYFASDSEHRNTISTRISAFLKNGKVSKASPSTQLTQVTRGNDSVVMDLVQKEISKINESIVDLDAQISKLVADRQNYETKKKELESSLSRMTVNF